MKKKRLIGMVLVVVFGLGLSGFLIIRAKRNELQYRTEPITRGEIVETVFASGTINAITTVSVGTQVSGRIKEIFVDYNSQVKKGQVIAQIDPSIFQAQVDQARANLVVAQANLERANAGFLEAKRTYERYLELFKENFISKSELDSAETNYNSARAQVEAAKAQIVQAKAAVEYAETNLKYTDIVSPVDGVVISRNVDVGQTVTATFQTPTLFLIAEDLTKMQINTNVNEADIGKIQLNQEAEFNVDAYPDLTFTGTVYQIRSAPNTVSGLQALQSQSVVTYDVVVRVENPELKLKPGMTANVRIITARKAGVLRIPNSALRFAPPEEIIGITPQRGYGVWVLKDKKPVRVEVAIGISDDSYTELIKGELKEGQEVIVGLEEKGKKKEKKGMNAPHPPRRVP